MAQLPGMGTAYGGLSSMSVRQKLALAALGILLLLFLIAMLGSPGTSDARLFEKWLTNAVNLGPKNGFLANAEDNPPLGTAILWLVHFATYPFGLNEFWTLKAAVLAALIITSVLVFFWTESALGALAVIPLLGLNSVALGYLDILFAFTLVGSLWALQARRYEIASALFAICALTKWQPLIIFPFVTMYFLIGERSGPDLRKTWFRVWPGALICLVVVAVYGWTPIDNALLAATRQRFLSGNALNFNWVLTSYLENFHSRSWGGLLNGKLVHHLYVTDSLLVIIRSVFYTFYGLILLLFALRKRTFSEFLLYSAAGFLCYFTFNTGAHENHLVVGALLLLVLGLQDKDFRVHALFVGAMLNINLFIFYNYTGLPVTQFDRAPLGIDITVLFAGLNTAFFLYFLTAYILPRVQDVRGLKRYIGWPPAEKSQEI